MHLQGTFAIITRKSDDIGALPLLPQSREQHRSIAAVLFCYIAEPGLPGRQQNNDYSWKEYPNPAREVRLSA